MRRPLALLLLLLGVVAIGGGVYLFTHQDKLADAKDKLTGQSNANSTTAMTNTVATTNTAPQTVGTKTEVKGNVAADGKATIADVALHFSSLQRATEYNGATAPKGSEFILVFFDSLQPSQVNGVRRALIDATQLSTKQGMVALSEVKVASTLVTGDRGYLKFTVPQGATDLALVFGTGASLQRVALPAQ